ncbi:hypothetical protein PAE77_19880 [Pseudomonas aeruginosa]|nr:hypothetical protein [Pseudomonas aeruginosa]HEP8230567.1 hypothetical protein [Pseudomonas aeruginosa]HEP8270294.1 hypothetical protein [Pseudomonas aeruginosa]
MKERPILFTGPMVRAILSGQKTVTRRVLKGLDPELLGETMTRAQWQKVNRERPVSFGATYFCPFGQPGDRLWVREAWAQINVAQAPGETWVVYRECDNRTDYGGPWKPSIHMRRRDSRILLEITAVRVERLHDITEDQAEAEGVERPENITNVDVWDGAERELFNAMNQPRARFRRLWSDINGSESWDSNPWVWVVEFKRVTP